MFIAPMVAVSFAVLAATSSLDVDRPITRMSAQEKAAAVQPAVQRATECVARRIADNPRVAAIRQPGVLGDMIVESMPACVGMMRAMIESFDRYFGAGAGEAYFSGPYLDALPTAVLNSTTEASR